MPVLQSVRGVAYDVQFAMCADLSINLQVTCTSSTKVFEVLSTSTHVEKLDAVGIAQ